MDSLGGSPGHFRNFRKDDFEADWIKVAECRFSQVYQVKLKLWREKCALKSFDSTVCEGKMYRRIMKEAPNIAKLKFKFIVFIYGLCSESNAVVMEYMCNGSLNDLLGSHNLMWSKKFQMIHETSMGMNFLHSMKPPLLHLNLKTSNILLDDHLHVKISDFGLIHWDEGLGTSFMEHLIERGNISYIPPETFAHCSTPPGYSFDVYSFGIIIWEILTQLKPYAGCSVTTVILHVSEGKRLCENLISDQRPTECNQMMNIMNLCWDHDPKKRPPFSDTVKNTEALSDIFMNSGPSSNQNGRVPIFLPGLSNAPPDCKDGMDGILSLLTKKDFVSFRKSVKREDVLMRFSEKRHLLHFTVASGDLECVKRVLSLGAEINCVTARGYTPLIVAVLHRFHDIVSLLLDYGANFTQGDEDQWLPLHFAAQNGDDKTVRLLLDRGAVADAREKASWMPLHLACQNGHESVVRLLLSRLSEEAAIDWKEAQGRTPLHLASAYGHVNIVKLLLSQGADPNITDNSLNTALHFSAEQGHYQVVRQLLKSKAPSENADRRGYTPLHLGALRGRTGICRQLLSSGANPKARTLQGWTPMHLAALRGHEATVVQMVNHAGCVNARGGNGWTPLHLACQQSEPEVVVKLLAARADPNIKEDSEGWTPLHLACSSVSFPCVLHLISHHADVNAISSSLVTPLHLAAQHGCEPIVKALLMNGANQTLLDSSGSTALNVARRCEKWEIAKLLES